MYDREDVGLFLHQQGLDTSTTAGKAMFQMLGVFAEFERGIIRERVNAGLARAKANGTKLGRRRGKPSVEARILELKAAGDGSSRSAGNLASAPVWCSEFLSSSRGHLDRMPRASIGALNERIGEGGPCPLLPR